MLSPGDGIALAGIAGIVVVGIIKGFGMKGGRYIHREECNARIEGFQTELKNIRIQLSEIDKFLRESK